MGSWPGADGAPPAVAKVRADPNTAPLSRLTAPSGPMDMVATATSSSSPARAVTPSSRATSRGPRGVTASLAISAPASAMARSRASMASSAGVARKSWWETTTSRPAPWARATSPAAPPRACSTSSAAGRRAASRPARSSMRRRSRSQ